MAREISNYLDENRSLRVGLDGADENRTNNVRNALIDAGVPAYKIEMGAFGDPQLRHNNRVLVMISSN
jgi:hypothetical protein